MRCQLWISLLNDSFPILISSAGRRVGLIDCFRRAAAELGQKVAIIACDQVPELSAGCRAADLSARVPGCREEGFIETVLRLVQTHGIRILVPTIDPELEALSEASPRLLSEGCRALVSPPDVIAVARHKGRTAEMLAAKGVPVPRTVSAEVLRADPDCLGWPVFAKPAAGSSSQGLAVFRSLSEVPDAFPDDMVFQEYLTGPEYTVNMFIDASGTLRCAIPHIRLRVRGGEVEKGRTVRRQDLAELAKGVATAIPDARGPICFQVIDDPKRGPRVIEINARFGGGYPLADHAGATFCRWLLEEGNGHPCTAHDNWRDGVEMLRYDAAFFKG
jgi:carbamoyl-phosphate synthase large subunit